MGGEKTQILYQPRVRCRSVKRRVRQVDYHISEWGDAGAPPLILLHGWGDCGASFQFLADELQHEWFLVAPDWRGFGDSRQRAESYWFPDYLADLDALLEEYSQKQPARIVGHSMGANVAGLYAGSRPERIAALVNIEGFGLADSDPQNAPDHYRRWLAASASPPQFSTYEDFTDLARRVMHGSPRLANDRALFIAHQWAAINDAGRVELKADPAHKLPNAVQYRRSEAAACWRRISAPVLSVVGSESRFASGAESFVESLGDSTTACPRETRVIDDCGHMVHLEQPERLAAVIDAFLGSL